MWKPFVFGHFSYAQLVEMGLLPRSAPPANKKDPPALQLQTRGSIALTTA